MNMVWQRWVKAMQRAGLDYLAREHLVQMSVETGAPTRIASPTQESPRYGGASPSSVSTPAPQTGPSAQAANSSAPTNAPPADVPHFHGSQGVTPHAMSSRTHPEEVAPRPEAPPHDKPVPPRTTTPTPVAAPTKPLLATTEQMFEDIPTGPASISLQLPPVDPALPREQGLAQLAREVAGCQRCPALVQCRTQTVFSDGSPHAELCFVGEAPGEVEDRTGKPFVGPAGQLLDRLIKRCGFQRDEVYICNVLKCRPPNNRPPDLVEVANCKPFFLQQLALVRPKIMVALGKHAAAALLGKHSDEVPVTRMRGTMHKYGDIPFMITYHPAYLLRSNNKDYYWDVWADMQQVMAFLGKPVT